MSARYIPSMVRADGTFCVIAKFKTAEEAAALHDPVTDWCKQWVANHQHWQRTAEEINIDKNGPWDYFAIFHGPPYVIKAEDRELWVRLDARVYSYWWRDWFAPMMVGLKSAFPTLKADGKLSFDCDEV
ncbi:MAG: hypothetical protein ABI690_04700 [Chloroflexota bacterium]